MPGTDHLVVEAAAKAKRDRERKKRQGATGRKSVSTIERVLALGIWAAAVGSLAAVMLWQ